MILRPFRFSPRPWWLPTGVTGADVVCAYQPKGAADASAALVNVANPGTNDATYSTTATRWDKQRGWWNEFATTVVAGAVLGPALGPDYTIAIACVPESFAGGRWVDKSGTGATTYFIGSGGQMVIRLGGVTDLVTLSAGTALRSAIMSDHDVYQDGEFFGTISGTSEQAVTASLVLGNTAAFAAPLRGELHAAVVYNKPLTAHQCKELHLGMRRL